MSEKNYENVNLTGKLVSGAFLELVEWFSVLKDLPKEKISANDPDFIKCMNLFEESVIYDVAAFIPYFQFEDSDDSALCKITKFDVTTGKMEISTKLKVPTGGRRTSYTIGYTCLQCYAMCIDQTLTTTITRLLKNPIELSKEEELNISALCYTIHTSMILLQIISKICSIFDKDLFDIDKLEDRMILQIRYDTFINNIINSYGLIEIEGDNADQEPYGKFHVQLYTEPDFTVRIEHISIVPANNQMG